VYSSQISLKEDDQIKTSFIIPQRGRPNIPHHAVGGGVYNLIYPRQTERIFRAVFVEISVINAHSPFFIILLNEIRVC
jgi:hypothetical protein